MKRIICKKEWIEGGYDDAPFWTWYHAWDKDDYCEVTDEEYNFLMQALDMQKKVQLMLADINSRRVTIPDDGVMTWDIPADCKPNTLCADRFKTVFALTEQP